MTGDCGDVGLVGYSAKSNQRTVKQSLSCALSFHKLFAWCLFVVVSADRLTCREGGDAAGVGVRESDLFFNFFSKKRNLVS